MVRLTLQHYHLLAPMIGGLDHHLAVASILAGRTHGEAWLDDLENPALALLSHGQRFYLAGDPGAPSALPAMKHFFQETVLPNTRQAGWEVLVVYADTPAWEAPLAQVFTGLRLQPSERQYYAIQPQALTGPLELPDGFRFVPADAGLLSDPGIAGLEELREEMCSERDSVEEFLEKSFGLCPLFGSQLAGWCLSEYNTAGRCEIGIATLPPYQRRGLATLQTLAFLDQAARLGYQQVGWHCYARNLPSAATARKAGLALVKQYTSYLAWIDS